MKNITTDVCKNNLKLGIYRVHVRYYSKANASSYLLYYYKNNKFGGIREELGLVFLYYSPVGFDDGHNNLVMVASGTS